jgi:hypothetical protein
MSEFLIRELGLPMGFAPGRHWLAATGTGFGAGDQTSLATARSFGRAARIRSHFWQQIRIVSAAARNAEATEFRFRADQTSDPERTESFRAQPRSYQIRRASRPNKTEFRPLLTHRTFHVAPSETVRNSYHGRHTNPAPTGLVPTKTVAQVSF